jgi:hypothetical protein
MAYCNGCEVRRLRTAFNVYDIFDLGKTSHSWLSLSVPKHGGNVAIFEFKDNNGFTHYKPFSTEEYIETHA